MSVADRLSAVVASVAEATERSGRPANAVKLVGVSKGSPPELVTEAVAAGLGDVAENRVQEAATKIPLVMNAVATPPRWHLVGHLQSNKARAALGLFDTIQAVDSVRIAEVLSRATVDVFPVFLEVQYQRTGERYGFDPEGIETALRVIELLPSLEVVGLMTVAPVGLDAGGVRAVFRDLRQRRDRLHDARPERPPLELSMGMSDDYLIAVEEGASVVRIGRAIFAG